MSEVSDFAPPCLMVKLGRIAFVHALALSLPLVVDGSEARRIPLAAAMSEEELEPCSRRIMMLASSRGMELRHSALASLGYRANETRSTTALLNGAIDLRSSILTFIPTTSRSGQFAG